MSPRQNDDENNNIIGMSPYLLKQRRSRNYNNENDEEDNDLEQQQNVPQRTKPIENNHNNHINKLCETNKKTRNNNTIARPRCCCCSLPLGMFIIIAMVGGLFVYRQHMFATWRLQYTTTTNHNDNNNKNHLDAEKVPPCEFEQLERVYYHATQATTTTNNNNDASSASSSSCWKLSEHVMRIPVDAISNRNNMVPVGNGRNGALFRVVLELNNGQRCGAVLKAGLTFSDYCQNLWHDPWHNLWHETMFNNAEYTWKCIESHWLGFSHLGGEYTGTLPFYASRSRRFSAETTSASSGTANNDFPSGLIPTWAVVTQPSPRRNLLMKFLNRMFAWANVNTPHPDRNIVGVVMPFSPVKTLHDMYYNEGTATEEETTSLSSAVLRNYTSNRMASKLLSAAEGLAYAHELGLAFQDLSDYNVGFRINDNKNNDNDILGDAVVFDNSFMGWQDTPTSSWVCPEAVFRPHVKGYHFNNFTAIRYGQPADVRRFKQSLVGVLEHCPDKGEANKLQERIRRSGSARELVRVLRGEGGEEKEEGVVVA